MRLACCEVQFRVQINKYICFYVIANYSLCIWITNRTNKLNVILFLLSCPRFVCFDICAFTHCAYKQTSIYRQEFVILLRYNRTASSRQTFRMLQTTKRALCLCVQITNSEVDNICGVDRFLSPAKLPNGICMKLPNNTPHFLRHLWHTNVI